MPTNTTQPGYAAQLKAWQAENPLRQWRKDNGITLHQTAAMVGCSVSTVQLWESGANVPSGQYSVKLKKILGPNTETRWNRWHKRQPEPPTA